MKSELIKFIVERYGWDEEQAMNAESFESLGLDSLSLYSLITDVEETFALKVETDDMTEIDSPRKFIDYIMEVRNHAAS